MWFTQAGPGSLFHRIGPAARGRIDKPGSSLMLMPRVDAERPETDGRMLTTESRQLGGVAACRLCGEFLSHTVVDLGMSPRSAGCCDYLVSKPALRVVTPRSSRAGESSPAVGMR